MWLGGMLSPLLLHLMMWGSVWCKLGVIWIHGLRSSILNHNQRHPLPLICPGNWVQVGPFGITMYSTARMVSWPYSEPPDCCQKMRGQNTKHGVHAVVCNGGKLSSSVQFIWENGVQGFVNEMRLRAGSPGWRAWPQSLGSGGGKKKKKKRFSLVLQQLQINRRLY